MDWNHIKASKSFLESSEVTESGLWYNTFLEEFQIWYVSKPRRYCVYMLTERFIKEDSNPEELWVKCFKKLEEFEQYLKSRRML
jgi:hypothetical protein